MSRELHPGSRARIVGVLIVGITIIAITAARFWHTIPWTSR